MNSLISMLWLRKYCWMPSRSSLLTLSTQSKKFCFYFFKDSHSSLSSSGCVCHISQALNYLLTRPLGVGGGGGSNSPSEVAGRDVANMILVYTILDLMARVEANGSPPQLWWASETKLRDRVGTRTVLGCSLISSRFRFI